MPYCTAHGGEVGYDIITLVQISISHLKV